MLKSAPRVFLVSPQHTVTELTLAPVYARCMTFEIEEKLCAVPKASLTLDLDSFIRAGGNVESLQLDTLMGTQVVLQYAYAPEQDSAEVYQAFAGAITQMSYQYEQYTRAGQTQAHIRYIAMTLQAWGSSGSHGKTFTKNYQIYQNKSCIDIARELIENAGGVLQVLEQDTGQAQLQHAYVVQYGESDSDFLARILARDGWLYAVVNDPEYDPSQAPQKTVRQVLQIFRTYSDLSNCAHTQVLSHGVEGAGRALSGRSVYRWQPQMSTPVNTVALGANHSSRSTLDYRATAQSSTDAGHQWIEVLPQWQHPDSTLSRQLAQQRLLAMRAKRMSFMTPNVLLHTGMRIQLQSPQASLAPQSVTIESSSLVVRYCSESQSWDSTLQVHSAVETAAPVLLPVIAEPTIAGVLRGQVIDAQGNPPYAQLGNGQVGSELWDQQVATDALGRVRVRIYFPGSHKATAQDATQVWLRCMTPWAGVQSGFWAAPRVGQEVIVSFLNGEADKPVVLGCMYSETCTAPQSGDSGQVLGSSQPWALQVQDGETSPDQGQYWVGLGTRFSDSRRPQWIRMNAHVDSPRKSPSSVEVFSAGNMHMAAHHQLKIWALETKSEQGETQSPHISLIAGKGQWDASGQAKDLSPSGDIQMQAQHIYEQAIELIRLEAKEFVHHALKKITIETEQILAHASQNISLEAPEIRLNGKVVTNESTSHNTFTEWSHSSYLHSSSSGINNNSVAVNSVRAIGNGISFAGSFSFNEGIDNINAVWGHVNLVADTKIAGYSNALTNFISFN